MSTNAWKLKFDGSVANLVYGQQNLGGTWNPQIGTQVIRTTVTEPGVYEYFADFVVSFGQRAVKPGASVFVNRLWANDELIYDRGAGFAAPSVVAAPNNWPPSLTILEPEVSTPVPAGAGLNGFTFFDGAETQGEVFRGMHYRGLMVGRFLNFNLTAYNNRIPSITAELIDVVPGDPANNVGGTVFMKYTAAALISEYRPEVDSLFRAYYRGTGAFPLNVDKARLSTKTQSFEIRLQDASYFAGAEPTPEELRDLQLTFIPTMNVAVGQQPGTFAGLKRLHDLGTGKTVAEFGDTGTATTNTAVDYAPWQACISFPVTYGGYTDYFVIGAASEEYTDYPIGILLVKDSTLSPAWFDALLSPVLSITVGKQREGSTDIYVTTADQIEKLTVGYAGSLGGLFAGSTASAVTREVFYTPASGALVQAFYDSARDRVIAVTSTGTDGPIVALDAAGVVVWSSLAAPTPWAKDARARTQETLSNLSAGTLVLSVDGSETDVTFVNLINGDIGTVVIPDNGTNDATLPLYWDSSTQILYSSAPRYVAIGVYPDASDDPSRYTAADVMRAYSVFVGYDTDDVVTTGLGSLFVDGYVASGPVSLAQVANGLGQLYGFGWSERAGKIVYKNNYDGDELVIDTTVTELATLTQGTADYFTAERLSDQSFPATLSLTYFDSENSYKRGYQVAMRNRAPTATMESEVRTDLTLPLTIDGDYAQELLYGAIYRVWANKLGYAIRVAAAYVPTDVGDVLSFTADGIQYNALITEHTINADNSLSLKLVDAASASYPVQVPTQPSVIVPSKNPSPVRLVLLDIPSRFPAQNSGGQLNMLALMAGYVPGTFRGAALDVTNSFEPENFVTAAAVSADQEAYIGSLAQELGTWEYPFEVDTYNSIYVTLGTIPTSKLVNADDAALDLGENLIAIGEGSEVELVQFGNVEDTGDGVWRLYNLRRGRYGTEVFMDTFYEGTAVSFLDNAKVVNYAYDDYEVGTEFLYRAYSPNQPLWQVDVVRHLAQGNSRKPYAPIEIVVDRDTGTGDLLFAWERRGRFYNLPPLVPGMVPPLDETTEAYEVHIFNGSGEVIRTIETATPNVAYSQSNQIGDGLTGTETELTFAVYQVSPDTVGIGLTKPDTFPIYEQGTQRLAVKFAGGGELAGDMIIPEVETFAAHMDGGGTMAANMITVLTFAVHMNGGGEMTANIFKEAVLLSADMAGGGELVGSMAPMPLQADFAGGGALGAALPLTQALGAAMEGGGVMTGDIAEPAAAVPLRFMRLGVIEPQNTIDRPRSSRVQSGSAGGGFFTGGAQYMAWTNNNNDFQFPVGIEHGINLFMRAVHRTTSATDGPRINIYRTDGTTAFELYLNANTDVANIYFNGSGTAFASPSLAAANPVVNTYFSLSILFVDDPTNGRLKIVIDGVTIYDQTGLNTSGGGSPANLKDVRLWQYTTTGTPPQYANLVMAGIAASGLFSDTLPRMVVDTLRPTSDISNAWNLSAGTTAWEIFDVQFGAVAQAAHAASGGLDVVVGFPSHTGNMPVAAQAVAAGCVGPTAGTEIEIAISNAGAGEVTETRQFAMSATNLGYWDATKLLSSGEWGSDLAGVQVRLSSTAGAGPYIGQVVVEVLSVF